MKKILLTLFITPIGLLFGQTASVDNITPGEFATYTFAYTNATTIVGTSSADDHITLLSVPSQAAFSSIDPVPSNIDSLAAHITVRIDGVEEPFTASNFSDWLSGVSAVGGVQISLHGTGNQVPAGSQIEVEISGVFVNSNTAGNETITWSTNKGTGAAVETFEDIITFGYLSIDQNTAADLNLSVFPNPTQNYVSISGFNGQQEYSIYNNAGVEVMSGATYENSAINIERLTSGFYFIKLENADLIKFAKRK